MLETVAGVALVVKAGDAAGSRLEVDGERLIGRSAEGPDLLGGDPRSRGVMPGSSAWTAAGAIRVERGWDRVQSEIEPKTRKGPHGPRARRAARRARRALLTTGAGATTSC
jgi:hypothetical protein